MTDDSEHETSMQSGLEREVEARARRKLRARRERDRSVWFGLGMFGLIGWSVAIPALLGIAAGVWIDSRWPSDRSWTLMLLILGVALGCLNAWNWLQRENSETSHGQRDDQDVVE